MSERRRSPPASVAFASEKFVVSIANVFEFAAIFLGIMSTMCLMIALYLRAQ